MSTPFKPIQIPPGVVAMPTKAMSSSNWAKVNLVRWREKRLSPVGGQLQYSFGVTGGAASFASRCKLVHGWYGIDGIFRVAYLCERHLYVDVGGIGGSVLLDITPTGGLAALPVITTGGYGDGTYGDPPNYGDPRGTTPSSVLLTSVPNAFSLDNFGAILYAMTSPDGRLLMWDPAVGGLAVVQPPATGRGPVPNGRCFVVTPERFIVIFGSKNDGTAAPDAIGRRFAWCDQENPGAWDYSNVTSQAGFLDVEPASPIMCAESTRSGTIFWTGKKAYLSRFLGLPYVYNYSELGDATTPWSPQSVVSTSSMVIWMSEQGTFTFDGTSILPVVCPVRPWVDADIDEFNVREQACAVHVENYSEWWWFFPQNTGAVDAATGRKYNTRAIIYNYKEGWWSQALMARSAGVTAAYNSHTIMCNGGIAYEHESVSSSQYSTDATLPFAETFNLNVYAGGGARLVTVKQLLPDIDSDDPNNAAGAIAGLKYSLFYRNSRSLGAPELQAVGVGPPTRMDGYVDFRVTGRDIRLRLDVVGPVLDFTVGQHLIDCVPRGRSLMASQPTPVGAQPPPELPNMPDVSTTLSNYLTRFSLWCRNGFQSKIDATTAAPGLLLQAYDAAPGTTPTVWMVRVNTAGTVSTVAVALGGGKP